MVAVFLPMAVERSTLNTYKTYRVIITKSDYFLSKSSGFTHLPAGRTLHALAW